MYIHFFVPNLLSDYEKDTIYLTEYIEKLGKERQKKKLNFLRFYLFNKETRVRKSGIFFLLYYFRYFHSRFPHSGDERAGK